MAENTWGFHGVLKNTSLLQHQVDDAAGEVAALQVAVDVHAARGAGAVSKNWCHGKSWWHGMGLDIYIYILCVYIYIDAPQFFWLFV